MNGRRCNPGGGMTIKLLLAAAVAAALVGGNAVEAQDAPSLSSNPDGCVTDYDAAAGVDYFPDKAVIDYASTFTVDYLLTYKILTISDGGDPVVYVLYQCGTPKPTLNETVQEYISIPVSKVSTGTTDHIPRIELLGHRESIVAYTGTSGRIGSPCVDALVDDGTVVEAIVFDTECQSDITDNKALVNASVEVAFGDTLYTSYCVEAPLRHNAVAVVSYLESGPTVSLGQSEAIKLFSLFYNEEARGNELFDEIETLWFCTKGNAQGCSLALDNSPTVAWFPYLPTSVSSSYYDAGSGYSAPDVNAYYGVAVNNTGGTILDCGEFPTLMTDDEMLACFADADVCVFAADYDEVLMFFDNDVLDKLACVQNERAYDITLSSSNAWFEAVWVEPHVLLQDLVVVLHGEDYNFGLESYQRLLLRNVATEQSGTASYYDDVATCDADEVVELQGGECELIIDFEACDDVSVTADGESPASKVVPVLSGLALAIIAAAGAVSAPLW